MEYKKFRKVAELNPNPLGEDPLIMFIFANLNKIVD